MSVHPICTILETALSTGIASINKATIMQSTIKKQTDSIIALTDLNTAVSQIPNFDIGLNDDLIKSLKSSCPGQFPDLGSIHTQIADQLKKYLNKLKGSPLGQLASLIDSLESAMKPINDLITTMYNYLTCLKNVCNLAQSDFDTKWQEITNAKTALNLDANGKPQILDNTTSSIMSSYSSKVNTITSQMNTFKL